MQFCYFPPPHENFNCPQLTPNAKGVRWSSWSYQFNTWRGNTKPQMPIKIAASWVALPQQHRLLHLGSFHCYIAMSSNAQLPTGYADAVNDLRIDIDAYTALFKKIGTDEALATVYTPLLKAATNDAVRFLDCYVLLSLLSNINARPSSLLNMATTLSTSPTPLPLAI